MSKKISPFIMIIISLFEFHIFCLSQCIVSFLAIALGVERCQQLGRENGREGERRRQLLIMNIFEQLAQGVSRVQVLELYQAFRFVA